MNLHRFQDMIGFTSQKADYKEKLISAIGGFIGIFGIFMSSYWLLDPEVSIIIIPSMGASAVLLFAAPHVPFSQPWNVFGGHAVSAMVGVACWQWIPDVTIAASASVGIAIGAMYMMRCIHPPGGATALAAVIGSDKLHNLGFSYELEPVLLNTITLLFIAIVFNYFFKWRQYPAHFPFGKKTIETEIRGRDPINHEDFVYALSHLDTLVDIDEEDLLAIYALATKRHAQHNKS